MACISQRLQTRLGYCNRCPISLSSIDFHINLDGRDLKKNRGFKDNNPLNVTVLDISNKDTTVISLTETDSAYLRLSQISSIDRPIINRCHCQKSGSTVGHCRYSSTMYYVRLGLVLLLAVFSQVNVF